MKLYQNTINGLRYRKWTRGEAFAYFLKGVARELRFFPFFFQFFYDYQVAKRKKKEQETEDFRKKEIETFKHKWLKQNGEISCFDFNGVKIPDVSGSKEKLQTLKRFCEDTFLFHCFLNDNYDKYIVDYLDCFMGEGPYGYTDEDFDVTVKKGDIVIDAGAWIGDYSAYAASKGAIVYAFEPVNESFQLLCKTKSLNIFNNEGCICPVQKGLGSTECEMNILIQDDNSGATTLTSKSGAGSEKISITTLDKFVEENKLEHIDFIKADIEGSERDMLRGAMNVLKNFAPKLAICTYHL
ncbi:MAG: FkbM family methyltransferase, partial [Tannerella sp.]|nr:FkbM family methyltransferase [Tannerella sp.]